MRLVLYIFSFMGIYILLVSATIAKKDATIADRQNIIMTEHSSSSVVKVHKLNFFQRTILKFLLKDKKLKKSIDADKLASTSLWLGIAAYAFILLALLLPYLIFASLPAAITAITTGRSALRNKTSLVRKAKTGKALGLGALIVFGLLLVVVVTILATLGSSTL